MATSSKLMITKRSAGFRFASGWACRHGARQRLNEMQAWLDENCGANGWAMNAPPDARRRQ